MFLSFTGYLMNIYILIYSRMSYVSGSEIFLQKYFSCPINLHTILPSGSCQYINSMSCQVPTKANMVLPWSAPINIDIIYN